MDSKKIVNALQGKNDLKARMIDEMLEMPGLFIIVTDTAFKLVCANKHFYTFFNSCPDEMQGRPMHYFLGEDVRSDMNEEHIARVLREGHVWEYDAYTVNVDREGVVIRWNQCTFKCEGGGNWILSVGIPQPQWTVREDEMVFRDTLGDMLKPGKNDIYETTDMPMELQKEIMQGIENRAFTLFFQPRVHARTKEITGAEALVRMVHPQRGLLLPASFIPIAEKTGKIVEIGNYVIEAACQKLRAWQDNGHGLFLSVSINISPRQLLSENFVQTLLASVSRYSIEPARLMIELSERTIAANFEEAQRAIQVLQNSGFRVSIDGYSGSFLPLIALTRLPVDNIKIERMHLARALHDRTAYPIVESIIVLVRGLNMTTTAEGVETRTQLEFLQDNDVDYLQGYLISRPLPEVEFERFIKINPDFYTRHI